MRELLKFLKISDLQAVPYENGVRHRLFKRKGGHDLKKTENLKKMANKLQMILAIVLFFTMLYSCARYIDIKINGKASSLPPVPKQEKQNILKMGAAENKVYTDELMEPLFMGVKNGDSMVCAAFDKEARASLENIVTPVLYSLFSGTSGKVDFADENQKKQYIRSLRDSEKYFLISYYDEIPASVFLPCLSSDYEIDNKPMYFNVKHIFIMNDSDESVYGIALSGNDDAYILKPDENVYFDKFSITEYDISDGFSYFTFAHTDGIHPVFDSSFVTNKYEVSPVSSKYGKGQQSLWIEKLLGIFNINVSFVKSYSSKNDTEMIYVEDGNELIVNDNGTVEYKSDKDGVSLEKYLEYAVDETGKYSFADKIFAVKNLINVLNFDNSLHRYCISGVDYKNDTELLTVYLKSFVNGVALSDNLYDAVFEIEKNYLVGAQFYAVNCNVTDEYSVCLNQSRMNELFDDEDGIDVSRVLYYPLLEKSEGEKNYFVSWARLSDAT